MKRFFSVLLLLVMLFALPSYAVSLDKNQVNKETPSALSKTIKGAAVADVTTDTLLYTSSSDIKVPAYGGISRLMTAVTIEYQNRQDTIFKSDFSKEAYEDHLASLLIKDDEAAARTLAVEVSGSIEDFVELMNTTASQIGMTNTTFTNPDGSRDTRAVTTVDDLLLLAYEAYNLSEIKTVLSSNLYYSLDGGSSYSRDYSILNPGHKSYNNAVNFYACGEFGDAGILSIVGAMNASGREVVAVTYESGSYVTEYKNNYASDITSLLNMSFSRYYIAELLDVTKAVVNELDGFSLADGTRVYASVEIPNDQKARKLLPVSYGEIIFNNYTSCSVDIGPLPESGELNSLLTTGVLRYDNDELLTFRLRTNRIVFEDGSEQRSEYSLYSNEEGKKMADDQYKKNQWIIVSIGVCICAALAVVGAEFLKRRMM